MNNVLSHVIGKKDIPLLHETVGNYLDKIATTYPNAPAVISKHQGIRWSYEEFLKKTNDLAANLLKIGLTKGDRIGIWSTNNAEWILTQYATAKIGLILVNINPAYRIFEVEYALDKVGCRALILCPSFKSSNYIQIMNELCPEIKTSDVGKLASKKVTKLELIIRLGEEKTAGMMNFNELLATASIRDLQKAKEVQASLHYNDPINIQFTSGTTGFPKGATLTHLNILNNGYFCGEAMKLTEKDKLCIPVPLYHCFGMVLGSLACITHGSAIVFPAEAFEPKSVLQTVSEEKCTGLHGVPTMFIAELEDPDLTKYDLSHLRTGIMAGSPCPIEVMKKVVSVMNMKEVTIAYGMTETSPVSFQSNTDTPVDKKVSTVGLIHPHVEVKIVNDKGEITKRGETGELCTKGYSVMLEYWDDKEKTTEALKDGWMYTGDLAVMDDEGYCNIVGRIKDMIIRGGENVYPREVEEFLYHHPKIQDVQVIGVPDKKYGEEVCAWIKLKEGQMATSDEIRDFCKERIAHYKIPRYIEFVNEFPMTITGKIQKYVMRDAMKKKLGLSEEKTA